MLTGHGFNRIPTWAETLLKGDVSGGTSPKLSDGDRLEAVNGLSYYDPRYTNTDGVGRLHADEILYISTNFRKKIIIGHDTNSGAADIPPTWQSGISTYSQVQINNVNFRGQFSIGTGIQTSSNIIGIGSEYIEIRWGNFWLQNNDTTNGGQTILSRSSKFNIADIRGESILTARSISTTRERILEVPITLESTSDNSSTAQTISRFILNHNYWNKSIGDSTGAAISSPFQIVSTRFEDPNNLGNYKGRTDISYAGNIALKIFENSDIQTEKLGVGITPSVYQLDVIGNSRFDSQVLSTTTDSIYFGKTIDGHTINETAIGHRAGNLNTGNNCVFIGKDAGQNNTRGESTSIGTLSGKNNIGSSITSIGYNSGNGNSGDLVTAIGYASGLNNTGRDCVFVGHGAGVNNSNIAVTAIGKGAGNGNSGSNVALFGFETGRNNSGVSVDGFGYRSCSNNTGERASGFGYSTLQDNQGDNILAAGFNAGNTNIGDQCVFLGTENGKDNSGSNVVSIGHQGGIFNAKSNAFIVSNLTLPEYADRTTALADLTLANGCVVSNTYLYYNQSNGVIESVRF